MSIGTINQILTSKMGKTLEKGGDKEGKQGKIWDNLRGKVTHFSTS